jgi:hypothetical protein
MPLIVGSTGKQVRQWLRWGPHYGMARTGISSIEQA